MKTQLQHFYDATRKQGEKDALLMEMLRHPTHPLTKAELRQMIEKHPDRYGRYTAIMENMEG